MSMFICGATRGAPLTEEEIARIEADPEWVPCCAGAAMGGPRDCTCWVPVYDLDQATPDTSIAPETRTQMCGDCAYRPDSPERSDDPWALVDLDVFWCHRGLRRPRVMRHVPESSWATQLGERPGDPADYQPPIIDGIPYRADGRPAARCGGWAEYQP